MTKLHETTQKGLLLQKPYASNQNTNSPVSKNQTRGYAYPLHLKISPQRQLQPASIFFHPLITQDSRESDTRICPHYSISILYAVFSDFKRFLDRAFFNRATVCGFLNRISEAVFLASGFLFYSTTIDAAADGHYKLMRCQYYLLFST